jgi:hypothetical protein
MEIRGRVGGLFIYSSTFSVDAETQQNRSSAFTRHSALLPILVLGPFKIDHSFAHQVMVIQEHILVHSSTMRNITGQLHTKDLDLCYQTVRYDFWASTERASQVLG